MMRIKDVREKWKVLEIVVARNPNENGKRVIHSIHHPMKVYECWSKTLDGCCLIALNKIEQERKTYPKAVIDSCQILTNHLGQKDQIDMVKNILGGHLDVNVTDDIGHGRAFD
jgi:hypothetical protein